MLRVRDNRPRTQLATFVCVVLAMCLAPAAAGAAGVPEEISDPPGVIDPGTTTPTTTLPAPPTTTPTQPTTPAPTVPATGGGTEGEEETGGVGVATPTPTVSGLPDEAAQNVAPAFSATAVGGPAVRGSGTLPFTGVGSDHLWGLVLAGVASVIAGVAALLHPTLRRVR